MHLKIKGYRDEILDRYISEANITGRERSLKNKENSTLKKILPFGTQYLLALPNFKNTVMENWNLIQNHLHSRVVFKSQPSMMLKRKVIKRYPG